MQPFLLCGPVCIQGWGKCRHPVCTVWSLYAANTWPKWPCFTSLARYGSYLVYKELGGFTKDAVVPLGLYGLQLALNWAWTPIFFGAHKLKWVYKTQKSFCVIVQLQQLCSFHTISARLRHSLRSSFSPGLSEPPWSLGVPSAALRLCWWLRTCPGCALPLLSTTASGETTPRKRTIRKDICGL